jgi:hypothetical protein
VTHLQSAFEEARSYSKYHPSKGYWWQFGGGGGATAGGQTGQTQQISKIEAEKKKIREAKKKKVGEGTVEQ